MAFSSTLYRAGLAVLLAALSACSSVGEEDVFGYEEDFVIPQPDMIPVTPDDNPGRTVDEMLNIKQSVTVKKAVPREPAPEVPYERRGRFGAKEKISLRKGLNAPDAGLVYGSGKRREAEVVRPLAVKEREKNEQQVLSEEEMLAEIVSPKKAEVMMVEVVSVQKVEETPAVVEEPVAQRPAPVALKPEAVSPEPEKKEDTLPVMEPLVKPAPKIRLTPPKLSVPEQKIELKQPEGKIELKLPERKIKLKEPEIKPVSSAGNGGIVLRPPVSKASESIEVFIEE